MRLRKKAQFMAKDRLVETKAAMRAMGMSGQLWRDMHRRK